MSVENGPGPELGRKNLDLLTAFSEVWSRSVGAALGLLRNIIGLERKKT